MPDVVVTLLVFICACVWHIINTSRATSSSCCIVNALISIFSPTESHKMMNCSAMGCGFQYGTTVSIWWNDWSTASGPWAYALALLGMFLLAFVIEVVRRANTWAHRRYMVTPDVYATWSTGDKFKAKAIRALLHFTHITLGYLVMLAVMTYNVGLFVVVMLGFGIGNFLVAENCLPAPIKGPHAKGDVVHSTDQLPLLDATACH